MDQDMMRSPTASAGDWSHTHDGRSLSPEGQVSLGSQSDRAPSEDEEERPEPMASTSRQSTNPRPKPQTRPQNSHAPSKRKRKYEGDNDGGRKKPNYKSSDGDFRSKPPMPQSYPAPAPNYEANEIRNLQVLVNVMRNDLETKMAKLSTQNQRLAQDNDDLRRKNSELADKVEKLRDDVMRLDGKWSTKFEGISAQSQRPPEMTMEPTGPALQPMPAPPPQGATFVQPADVQPYSTYAQPITFTNVYAPPLPHPPPPPPAPAPPAPPFHTNYYPHPDEQYGQPRQPPPDFDHPPRTPRVNGYNGKNYNPNYSRSRQNQDDDPPPYRANHSSPPLVQRISSNYRGGRGRGRGRSGPRYGSNSHGEGHREGFRDSGGYQHHDGSSNGGREDTSNYNRQGNPSSSNGPSNRPSHSTGSRSPTENAHANSGNDYN